MGSDICQDAPDVAFELPPDDEVGALDELLPPFDEPLDPDELEPDDPEPVEKDPLPDDPVFDPADEPPVAEPVLAPVDPVYPLVDAVADAWAAR
jgi:hypothetical protein